MRLLLKGTVPRRFVLSQNDQWTYGTSQRFHPGDRGKNIVPEIDSYGETGKKFKLLSAAFCFQPWEFGELSRSESMCSCLSIPSCSHAHCCLLFPCNSSQQIFQVVDLNQRWASEPSGVSLKMHTTRPTLGFLKQFLQWGLLMNILIDPQVTM